MSHNKWYACGLNFECQGCGRCCSGPEEGYIWITKKEIEFLASFLGLSVEEVHKRYLKKIGQRYSIIEDPKTKDCIFLQDMGNGHRGCAVYSVRPNQCRTWPFWTMNLESDFHWNYAGATCPGINRGRRFTLEEIEAQRLQRRWWNDDDKK